MLFIGLGAGAFLLFFLYEVHVVSGHFRVLHACFLSGCLLLTAATLGLAAGAVFAALFKNVIFLPETPHVLFAADEGKIGGYFLIHL